MTSRVVTTMGPRSRVGLQNPALELFRSATSKSVRFGSHPLQFFHVGKKKKLAWQMHCATASDGPNDEAERLTDCSQESPGRRRSPGRGYRQ